MKENLHIKYSINNCLVFLNTKALFDLINKYTFIAIRIMNFQKWHIILTTVILIL